MNQFILHGNVNDRLYLPLGNKASLGGIRDFLLRVLLPTFDVILSYDLGNGIRVEKGGEIFSQVAGAKETPELPRQPRPAIEFLTRYFRYTANLARPGQAVAAGRLLRARLSSRRTPLCPARLTTTSTRSRCSCATGPSDDLLVQHAFVTCLIADNLNDSASAHRAEPTRRRDPGAAAVRRRTARRARAARAVVPKALPEFKGKSAALADQLTGASVNSIEELLKVKEHASEAIQPGDLVQLKKSLVEKDCGDLIEFIESKRTLDDVHGQDKLKAWLRQDVSLWRDSQVQALPMGYPRLRPGRHGQDVPRRMPRGRGRRARGEDQEFPRQMGRHDRGQPRENLRLLHALGRCFVFIDEADQALGPARLGRERRGALRPRLLDDREGNERRRQPGTHHLGARLEPARPDRSRPQAPRPRRCEDSDFPHVDTRGRLCVVARALPPPQRGYRRHRFRHAGKNCTRLAHPRRGRDARGEGRCGSCSRRSSLPSTRCGKISPTTSRPSRRKCSRRRSNSPSTKPPIGISSRPRSGNTAALKLPSWFRACSPKSGIHVVSSFMLKA